MSNLLRNIEWLAEELGWQFQLLGPAREDGTQFKLLTNALDQVIVRLLPAHRRHQPVEAQQPAYFFTVWQGNQGVDALPRLARRLREPHFEPLPSWLPPSMEGILTRPGGLSSSVPITSTQPGVR